MITYYVPQTTKLQVLEKNNYSLGSFYATVLIFFLKWGYFCPKLSCQVFAKYLSNSIVESGQMRLPNGRVRVGSSRLKNSRVRVGYANMQVLDHSLDEMML